MSYQLLTEIETALGAKIKNLSEQIVNGHSTDFPDYKRRCGEVRAYRDAIEMARVCQKKRTEGDDG